MKRIMLVTAVMSFLCFQSYSESPVQVSVLKNDLTLTAIPYLYEKTVLFQDYSEGFIYLRTVDIESRQVVNIRKNSKYLYPLAFSGSHVSWIEYTYQIKYGAPKPGSPAQADTLVKYFVKAMNVSDKSESSLTNDTTYKEHIAAYGDKVVWTDYRHFTPGDTTVEIYLYDFTQKKETRITNAKGYKAFPHIYGNKIVWQDYRNAAPGSNNADIYLYDLQSQTEITVTTNTAFQSQPQVFENLVVWQDYRNAGGDEKNADIYLKDLTSGSEKVICSAPGFQNVQKIFGNYIVWQDYRNALSDTLNADLYLYDMSKGEEFPITTKSGYQGEAFLWGNHITWQDYADGFLYLGVISPLSSVHNRVIRSQFGVSEGVQYFGLSGRKMSSEQGPNKLILKLDANGKVKRITEIR